MGEDYSAYHTCKPPSLLKELQAEGLRCEEAAPSWGYTEISCSLAPSLAPRLGGYEQVKRDFCCASLSLFVSMEPRHQWPLPRMESAPDHSQFNWSHLTDRTVERPCSLHAGLTYPPSIRPLLVCPCGPSPRGGITSVLENGRLELIWAANNRFGIYPHEDKHRNHGPRGSLRGDGLERGEMKAGERALGSRPPPVPGVCWSSSHWVTRTTLCPVTSRRPPAISHCGKCKEAGDPGPVDIRLEPPEPRVLPGQAWLSGAGSVSRDSVFQAVFPSKAQSP